MTATREETGVYGWFARLFRRLFHTPDHPDRGFYRAVAAILCIGVISLGLGLWAVMDPQSVGPTRTALRLAAGIFFGPLFIVIGLGAIVRRWRQGPQPRGRHTQD